ncbi:MAG: ATP-binding cassette domain-containing protein [Clostridia bacterium]|nr:ATP-binding cassette domain-containing protein [Clostridia bacterium]
MEYILKTVNLSKKYKNKLVLDKVNISVKRGDVYGFVGENGSGKTTVIRLVCGLINSSGGGVELFGVKDTDPAISAQRKKIGAVVETPSIYLNMSAVDNLKMQYDILGLKNPDKIAEVLEEVGLSYLINDKKHAGNFSLGMRQRLGIAMALLCEPELLILDEPMNGLDPTGIVEMRELILKLNREKNVTFLISSHILTELSLVATTYGIISKGKLITEISAQELQRACERSVYLQADDNAKLYEVLKARFGENVKVDGAGVRVYGNIDLNGVLACAMQECKLITVDNSRFGIEEYYLSIMGGGRV